MGLIDDAADADYVGDVWRRQMRLATMYDVDVRCCYMKLMMMLRVLTYVDDGDDVDR